MLADNAPDRGQPDARLTELLLTVQPLEHTEELACELRDEARAIVLHQNPVLLGRPFLTWHTGVLRLGDLLEAFTSSAPLASSSCTVRFQESFLSEGT